MANLFANVCQIGSEAGSAQCLDFVTGAPARLLNLADYGFAVGHPADIVVLDCATQASAVAEVAAPLFGLRWGRQTCSRPLPVLHCPTDGQSQVSCPAAQAGHAARRRGVIPVSPNRPSPVVKR